MDLLRSATTGKESQTVLSSRIPEARSRVRPNLPGRLAQAVRSCTRETNPRDSSASRDGCNQGTSLTLRQLFRFVFPKLRSRRRIDDARSGSAVQLRRELVHAV